MESSIADVDQIGRRAQELYENRLRSTVETEENIGKILVIDLDSSDYEIDKEGLAASKRLRARRPSVDPKSLFAIRIGYDAVYTLGGTLTRTSFRTAGW